MEQPTHKGIAKMPDQLSTPESRTSGKPPSLADYAESSIKQQILENELKPREQISIDQLAAELGVSRTPVRDALMRLEAQSFVFSPPNRSPRVTPITRTLVHELYVVRKPLECLAVRLATPRLTDETISQLEQLLAEIKTDEDVNIDKHFHGDTVFHRSLLEAASNEWLQKLLQSITEHVYRIRRFAKSVPGDHLWKAYQDHIDILEAVKKRDAETAEKLMSNHIHNSRKRIMALLD
jgi:DNA-binding GntR family transcriptional regulator